VISDLTTTKQWSAFYIHNCCDLSYVCVLVEALLQVLYEKYSTKSIVERQTVKAECYISSRDHSLSAHTGSALTGLKNFPVVVGGGA